MITLEVKAKIIKIIRIYPLWIILSELVLDFSMELGHSSCHGQNIPVTSPPGRGEANCDICLSRYDLGIRYIPSDFMEKFQEDRTTMLYFYQQVSNVCVYVCV